MKDFLTLQPKEPYVNLLISVLAGSVIATVFYTLQMAIRSGELGFSAAHILFGGLAMLIFAPLYGGVFALVLVVPLIWIATRVGYAGPGVLVSFAALPILLLEWYHWSIVFYPVATVLTYLFLAYPSLTRPWRKAQK